MPWVGRGSFSGVIVSYVEAKMGEEDAFFCGACHLRDAKSGSPVRTWDCRLVCGWVVGLFLSAGNESQRLVAVAAVRGHRLGDRVEESGPAGGGGGGGRGE